MPVDNFNKHFYDNKYVRDNSKENLMSFRNFYFHDTNDKFPALIFNTSFLKLSLTNLYSHTNYDKLYEHIYEIYNFYTKKDNLIDLIFICTPLLIDGTTIVQGRMYTCTDRLFSPLYSATYNSEHNMYKLSEIS